MKERKKKKKKTSQKALGLKWKSCLQQKKHIVVMLNKTMKREGKAITNKLDKIFDADLVKTVNNKLVVKKRAHSNASRLWLAHLHHCTLTVHVTRVKRMKSDVKEENKQSLIIGRIKNGFAFTHGAVESLCNDLLEVEAAVCLPQTHHLAKCNFTQKNETLLLFSGDGGQENEESSNKLFCHSCCSGNSWLLCCTCRQSKLLQNKQQKKKDEVL